jgi:predicted transposase/invertase (TIGR01784 family)
MNMLITEWDWDKYVEVQRREAGEEGIEKGIEKGIKKGLKKGREEGREEIARNALAEGASVEFVRKITGFDMQTIQRLAQGEA